MVQIMTKVHTTLTCVALLPDLCLAGIVVSARSYSPTLSASFAENHRGSGDSTVGEHLNQKSVPEKVDNPPLRHHYNSDIFQTTHSTQDFGHPQASNKPRNHSSSGLFEPQEPQGSPAPANIRPTGIFDWDLLFSAPETILEQNHSHQNMTEGVHRAFPSEDFPFSVFAANNFDNLWDEFHANV
ncbi:hypothetical protein ASPWEDRAFT_306441 [Aspergillus wentii DTO 134E9]|uniref:Uncharacterized protein n=1 Tax=Aspergillus wentii DTO 134E9 TaxID=1073089 RepID=A0A1L9R3V4_ASPWE|nr:uncharacterized protein ASPWEDRAFT_306441 [Aspergillus wentii DTO 134E9]OJJ29562.1 hypothetical protein ASPWEDRAFT_306441 [Aspergillus wentii DTO 134E9]